MLKKKECKIRKKKREKNDCDFSARKFVYKSNHKTTKIIRKD